MKVDNEIFQFVIYGFCLIYSRYYVRNLDKAKFLRSLIPICTLDTRNVSFWEVEQGKGIKSLWLNIFLISYEKFDTVVKYNSGNSKKCCLTRWYVCRKRDRQNES